MRDHLRRFAAGFGIEGLRQQDHLPNTRRALLLAEHGRDRGRLHPLRRAVMEAHWERGEDIEDDAVLAACARAAGMDPEAALRALVDPALGQRLDAAAEEAARARVSGIPTFVIGGRRIVGCQGYEVLAAAAEAAGARRLRPTPAPGPPGGEGAGRPGR
jgi:predicted DsbA family dithiol-disulfide isomerase